MSARLSSSEIEQEFDVTASRYDLMVSLNPGYHDQLRVAAQAMVDSVPRDGRGTVVDLGCGSGASTVPLVDLLGTGVPVIGIDNSAGMLDQARAKKWPPTVRFVQAPAGELAARVTDGTLPGELAGVQACYLFRNVTDLDGALADTYAVLAPGAPLVVHEYSLAGGLRPRLVWSLVCWLIVIPLSLVLTRRTRLYRYLWRSVLRFDTASRFQRRLTDAGFVGVSVLPAGGWQQGVLHTFVAFKPSR